MEYEPERIELYYFVRYYDEVAKKFFMTRYRMTEAAARDRFKEFELVLASREERRVGGDLRRDQAGCLYAGWAQEKK